MSTTIEIPSDLQAAREVEQCLLEEVSRYKYSDSARFAIKLALEEGLNNAIKHGNGYDSSKLVKLSYDVDESRTVITISDEGCGFDPDEVPDPTADENIEKPCGRGIMLMRAYMDEVSYNPQGNRVRMVKQNN